LNSKHRHRYRHFSFDQTRKLIPLYFFLSKNNFFLTVKKKKKNQTMTANNDVVSMELTFDKRVAVIHLNRPKRGNAITPEMGEQVHAHLDAIESNGRIRVLVLTGSGKYFCTGMDLGNAHQADMAAQLASGVAADRSLRLFKRIRSLSVPVVARVNGAALGGGWGLLFCCDVRVAVRSAWFQFSEVKRGIVPALISSWIVPEIGPFLAGELMMSGRRVPADEAHRLGMLSVVCNDDALDDETDRVVEQLLTSAPGASADVKRLVRALGDAASADERERIVKQVFARTIQSDEAAYGVGQFLQKQRPDWDAFHRQHAKL
jgi:enoyl-CoA hydratase/carnithine racemase